MTWVETSRPWELESRLLSSGLRLPLNLHGNPWTEAVTYLSVVRLKARQLADDRHAVERATVRQKKTGQPIRFELTEQTRQAIDDYMKAGNETYAP